MPVLITRRHIRYALEVDVDFVRKVVRTIGRTAIRIQSAATKCIDALVELIQTKVSYVVQEGVIVIRVCGAYPTCCDTQCMELFPLYHHRTSSAVIPTNMNR